jgi:hypothetical protein
MMDIYGASDDLVVVEGHPEVEDIDCDGSRVVLTLFDARRGRGAQIEMAYDSHLCAWVAKVGQTNPEHPLLPLRLGSRGSSVLIRVEAEVADIHVAYDLLDL